MGLLRKIWSWFTKEILNQPTERKYLHKWVSKNQKIELYSLSREQPGAIATYSLKNSVDGTGEVLITVDNISELIRVLNQRKLTESANFRYKLFERDLETSHTKGITHRITVTHVYLRTLNGKKQWNKRLYQVIDTCWSDSSYNRDYDISKYLALYFLNQEMPRHWSDWSEYVCDRNSFDWGRIATAVAQKVYGDNYNPKTSIIYTSQVIKK